jgi:hypothetical protein
MYMKRYSAPNASPVNVGIFLTLFGIIVFSLFMSPYEGFDDVKEEAKNHDKKNHDAIPGLLKKFQAMQQHQAKNK